MATTLAPAATHQSGLSDPPPDAVTSSATIGTIAAVWGMLSTNAPATAEPKIRIVHARNGRSSIRSAA